MASEVILRPDGTAFCRSSTETELGDVTQRLVNFAEHKPFAVPYITQNWHLIRIPDNSQTIAFRTVNAIRFNASFIVAEVEGELLVYPAFRMDINESDPRMVEGLFEWRPRADIQVVLAVSVNNSHFIPYLFFRDKINKHIYRPPVGNLYDDSKVCLGSFHRTHNGIVETSQQILNWIMSSRWNSDLRYFEDSQSMAMFSWAMDKEQRPIPDDWQTKCERFSSPVPNVVAEYLNTGVVDNESS